MIILKKDFMPFFLSVLSNFPVFYRIKNFQDYSGFSRAPKASSSIHKDPERYGPSLCLCALGLSPDSH